MNAPPAPRDPSGRAHPRGYLFEDQFDRVWDQRLVRESSTSLAPAWFALAQEVYQRRDEYDLIVTWGERLTLGLAALQQMFGPGKPHVALVTQFSKPNIDLPMRLVGRQLQAAIAFSSVQRDYAVRHGHVSAERLYLVRYLVDTQFYRPQPGADDCIAAVGAEMRDYATLFAALEGTDLRCHVAAGDVRVPGPLRMLKDRRVPVERFQRHANPHVTIGRRTLTELRDLYARARFVVV
ncbi:MAG: hypothetical protein R2708_25215, partial [Vicinamibacterales bacterium]